jgi:phosphoadenosine phosphosulfate reductase
MSNILFDPIKTQASVTDSVIVAFSGGKDSIVTLDLCFKYFKNVQPFFMYLVPNLEFQESMLQWYEKKYNTEIIRIPHFELSEFLKYGSFAPPDFDVNVVGINDTYEYLRQRTGIDWIAAGERCADSIVRNAMIKKSGSIDYKRGRFYPLAYWKKQEVMQYIKYKKLYLSPEQKKIGFSFRSLAGKELATVKELYPNDFEKILQLFPFAGAAVEHYYNYEVQDNGK